MSHEIRTPLNAIVGFSELLANATNEDEKREYIDIIKKNNELLLQLISDILDLSKIEAQSLEFVYEKIDVNNLCNSIITSSNLRPDAQVPVIFDKYQKECFIFSDKNRVSQVISNLINNALKFTYDGTIKVGYNLINEERDIEFYVKDTGPGIPKEKRDIIFDRFVKLDTFVQGTGLGLPICKSIIEQLNGKIGVDSVPGKGARFWFTLPHDNKLNTHPINKVEPMTTTKPTTQNRQKPLILVAEDIESNYLLIQCVLQKEYRLLRACNGKEAVELCKLHNPDLILMDIKMPEMDGLEATRKIRKEKITIPIIALTAFAFDTDIQKAMDAGCSDFLTKPVSIPSLKEKVASFTS